jgi:hypothetical protein
MSHQTPGSSDTVTGNGPLAASAAHRASRPRGIQQRALMYGLADKGYAAGFT